MNYTGKITMHGGWYNNARDHFVWVDITLQIVILTV